VEEQGGVIPDLTSRAVEAREGGTRLGGYLAARAQSFGALTSEVGVRVDRETHTRETHFSPRVLLRWDPDRRTSLKGGIGRYVQSQAVHELRVPDGETTFQKAEIADQVTVGVERVLGRGIRGRLELYSRKVNRPSSLFLNLTREVTPLPELELDRVEVVPSGLRNQGVELVLAREEFGPWSWSASYSLSRAEGRFEDGWAPLPFDQRHTFNLHAKYRRSREWTFSGSWQYQSGWPYTERHPIPVEVRGQGPGEVWTLTDQRFGPLNGMRLPPYHRLDLRAMRTYQIGDGSLEVYLDVFNAYGRENLRAYDFHLSMGQDGGFFPDRSPGSGRMPFLPTIGFRWVF